MLPLMVVVTFLAIAWLALKLRVVADVACGYKAKVLCTAIFASGRDLDPRRADEISADSYWLLRPFRAEVDRRAGAVTVSFLGTRAHTAIYRPGLGATLVYASAPHEPPFVVSPSTRSPAASGWASPLRTYSSNHEHLASHPGVQRVVDRAFEEPNPARLRRTHAVLVCYDGDVIAERYARGVGAGTPLPGWSMAKSVLNALVGILVADGRLALDHRELLPEWRSPDPRSAIALEDLLRMRSGLRFSEAYGNPWSDVLHMLFNCPDSAGYAASRPLVNPPGRVWAYASGTSNIVSAIVGRTVGSSYPEWPKRGLFDPLQMDSAILEPDEAGTFVCSSYMLATARDWARYGQLWLDDGRTSSGEVLLPAEWVRFSTTPTPESEGRYGAHWWLRLNPEIGGNDPAAGLIAPDALFAIGHEGQTLTIIPSRRLVVVRLGASIHIDAWNHAQFIAELQDAL
jgi:CubicO group peptidase (beta-lactamase class C family)